MSGQSTDRKDEKEGQGESGAQLRQKLVSSNPCPKLRNVLIAYQDTDAPCPGLCMCVCVLQVQKHNYTRNTIIYHWADNSVLLWPFLVKAMTGSKGLGIVPPPYCILAGLAGDSGSSGGHNGILIPQPLADD